MSDVTPDDLHWTLGGLVAIFGAVITWLKASINAHGKTLESHIRADAVFREEIARNMVTKQDFETGLDNLLSRMQQWTRAMLGKAS